MKESRCCAKGSAPWHKTVNMIGFPLDHVGLDAEKDMPQIVSLSTYARANQPLMIGKRGTG